MPKLLAFFWPFLILLAIGGTATAQANPEHILAELRNQQAQQQENLANISRQRQRLEQNQQSLQEHMDALSGSQQIFFVLQQQKRSLPKPQPADELSEQIANIRLAQFQLSQALLQPDINPDERLRIQSQQDQLQQGLLLALALRQEQTALLNISEQLEQDLNDRLFWLPSNQALSLQWLQNLPRQIQQQGQSLSRAWQAPSLAKAGPPWAPPLALACLLMASLGLAMRRSLRSLLQRAHERFESGRQQAPQPAGAGLLSQTLQALALVALLSAPASLLFAGLGLSFFGLADPWPQIGTAFIAVAMSLFVVQTLSYINGSSDIGRMHFGWSKSTHRTLRQFLQPFGWILVVSSFSLSLADQQQDYSQDIFGFLLIMFSSCWIAYLFARLLRQLPNVYGSASLQGLLGGFLVMLPLALALLTALGFYYTSLQLTGKLLASLYVLAGWVIVQSLINLGLGLASERLAYDRAQEDALQQALALTAAEDELTPSSKPLPRLDIEQIQLQSKRLADLCLLLLFGSLFYWVWADSLSALAFINQWVLFRVSGDGIISLGDILGTGIIIGLTLFLAKNLPGLLEILLLSRLRLQQGSSYAITTLMNYSITSLGAVLALSSLGVSWDKLQWLVAALSVGLGFGLQEIFANFVSGLIILFERPIRIGDVVTLGNLSGKVRQIRIRATTITDFDRKEIIVPNKTFVTGQLINWSLTDTVTRVIVRVGVAYGSNLDEVKSVLLAAARRNSRVLKDPEPQVLFLNFGDSTLDHELRLHVNELGDRNPCIDEINRYIDREFKQRGIVIAFRQLDVTLRNSQGDELTFSPATQHPSDSAAQLNDGASLKD